jgi:hypothetical protein
MEDNWIPRPGLQRPWSLKPNAVISNVCDLLLEEGHGWSEEKLNATFFEGDVTDILSIPVGCAGTEDYAACNYTRNGIFTVRSAYHLNMHLKNAGWAKLLHISLSGRA